MLEYIINLSKVTNISAIFLTEYYYSVKEITKDDKMIKQHLDNNFKSLRYDNGKNKSGSYSIYN